MHNLSLAVETLAVSGEIAIVGGGTGTMALGALLASRGMPVRPSDYRVSGVNLQAGGSTFYRNGPVTFSVNVPSAYMRSPDVLVLWAKDVDYVRSLDKVAEQLRPGQTVFVVDAPLGAAFELSQKIFKLRKRMAVNLIETGPVFKHATMDNGVLKISGLKDQVPVCGRSVNETRSGISVGDRLFNGLVPASSIFERWLADGSEIIIAAKRLFHVMEESGARTVRGRTAFSTAEPPVLSALEEEIQALGKVFNVSIGATKADTDFGYSQDAEKNQLANEICDNIVLISDLAKLAYQPVPAIDSIIELASVILGKDLRRCGRHLEDLGLSGMNIHEVLELINS